MKRRILFLDMDGVLNSHRFMSSRTSDAVKTPEGVPFRAVYDIDPEAVARLNRLFEAIPAVEVVLSSTWRVVFPVDVVQHALEYRGFTGKIVDITPSNLPDQDGRLYRLADRGDEIRKWLDDNASDAVFGVVDDTTDMAAVLDRCVFTTWFDGIEDVHVDGLISLLSESMDEINVDGIDEVSRHETVVGVER